MMSDTRGIYRKFNIERTDGDPTGKHQACNYFVLDLIHDEFAIPALRAYAKACAKKHPQLAKDIRWALQLASGPQGEYFPMSVGAALRIKMEHEEPPR